MRLRADFPGATSKLTFARRLKLDLLAPFFSRHRRFFPSALRGGQKRLEPAVERLACLLDAVSRAGDHCPFCAKLAFEHVADGVEGGVVTARDDQLREPDRADRI